MAISTAMTGPSNDSAVLMGPDGQVVFVEQGPRVIVEFFLDPPTWAGTAILLVASAVVGLAVVGAYRHGIDRKVLEEIAEIVAIVGGITITTWIISRNLQLPYVLDVCLGTCIGFATGKTWFFILRRNSPFH